MPTVGMNGVACTFKQARRALALNWQASPVLTVSHLLVTVVLGGLPAGLVWCTKLLLDSLQFPGRQAPSAVLLIVAIGVASVAAAGLPHFATFLKGRLRRTIGMLAQEQLFQAVNRFDGLSRFENPEFLDRLRLAQQSSSHAPDQVTTSILGVLQGLLTAVSLLGVLFAISPVMAWITVIAAVPALLMQMSTSRRQAGMMLRISPRSRRQWFYQSLMMERTAVKEVRLFGLGGFLVRRMRQETIEINKAEDRLGWRVLATQGPLAVTGAVVATCGLAWIAGGAATGRFGIGDVTAFFAAVTGVQAALAGVVSSIAEGYAALLMFRHFVGITAMESDVPRSPSPRRLESLSHQVEFRDVWFRYDGGPWILKGINLTIPFGQSLAVVGLNGAGKSTLIKLLCRFYDPVQGSILWDGIDIRDFDAAEFRQRISAVFQDFMAYDLSASDNIGLGDLRHYRDSDRVKAASQMAGSHEFLTDLQRGYATMLSRAFFAGEDNNDAELGVTLSGGQWQRVALARALMRQHRDLLILDEPSAGLDAAAEQAVHDRLREHQAGTTSLLISHRLGTVRWADHILVLQNGVVLESGTHDDLVAAQGEYARLFAIQAADYLEPGDSPHDAHHPSILVKS